MSETESVVPEMTNREIDARIAMAVFGWGPTATTCNPKQGWKQIERIAPNGKSEFPAECTNDETRWDYVAESSKVPTYSTHLIAAWGVMEKLKEQGFAFSLFSGAEWIAYFDKNGSMGGRRGETVPLAICLAALKAMRVAA